MSNWLFHMQEVQRTLNEATRADGSGYKSFNIDRIMVAEKMMNDLIKQYLGHVDEENKLVKDKKIAKLEKILNDAIASFKEIQASIETAPAVAPELLPEGKEVDIKFYTPGGKND